MLFVVQHSWCFSWYLDDSVPTSMKPNPRGLSHFSITDCRSTFVFPFLDKRTWCSWNALPNRVKDLWRGGAAIDHNRRKKRNEGEKKDKEEERKQDWVENIVTQSYLSNSRSHYTALNRERRSGVGHRGRYASVNHLSDSLRHTFHVRVIIRRPNFYEFSECLNLTVAAGTLGIHFEI